MARPAPQRLQSERGYDQEQQQFHDQPGARHQGAHQCLGRRGQPVRRPRHQRRHGFRHLVEFLQCRHAELLQHQHAGLGARAQCRLSRRAGARCTARSWSRASATRAARPSCTMTASTMAPADDPRRRRARAGKLGDDDRRLRPRRRHPCAAVPPKRPPSPDPKGRALAGPIPLPSIPANAGIQQRRSKMQRALAPWATGFPRSRDDEETRRLTLRPRMRIAIDIEQMRRVHLGIDLRR